jgi:hypothetical protein
MTTHIYTLRPFSQGRLRVREEHVLQSQGCWHVPPICNRPGIHASGDSLYIFDDDSVLCFILLHFGILDRPRQGKKLLTTITQTVS